MRFCFIHNTIIVSSLEEIEKTELFITLLLFITSMCSWYNHPIIYADFIIKFEVFI